MPIQKYTGAISEASGLNAARTISLQPDKTAYGVANSVKATIGLSTTSYGREYLIEVTILCSDGSEVKVTKEVKLDSSNYTQAYVEITGFDASIVGINNVQSIKLYCASNGNTIFAKGQQVVEVTYTEPTKGTSPGCAVSPTLIAPGGTATLSWSAGSAGVANTILGYRVEQSENGSSWTTLITVGANTLSCQATASSTQGAKRYFRVSLQNGYDGLYSSPGATSTLTSFVYSACTLSSLTLDATVVETATSLKWAGLAAGSNSPVRALEIYFASSDDGETFSGYSELQVISSPSGSGAILVHPPAERGRMFRYRARALSTVGEAYNSPWVYSEALVKNQLPNTPTGITVQPVYDPNEGLLRVSFSSGGDPDNNLKHMLVAFCSPTTNTIIHSFVGVNLTNSHVYVDPSSLTRGSSWRIALCGVDIFDVQGEWGYSESLLQINHLQAIPAVDFPPSGARTYNLRPRIGISLGSGTPGKAFSLALTYDGVQRRTVGAFSSEFSRAGATIPSGAKVLWQAAADSTYGSKTVQDVLTNDGYSDIEPSYRPPARLVSVALVEFTDPELRTNVTNVKATHITELRGAINSIEQYYNLPRTAWAEEIIAKRTFIKSSHIQEMRNAIERVVQFINTFDTSSQVNDVPQIIWTDKDLYEQPIKAVHVEELRNAITIL